MTPNPVLRGLEFSFREVSFSLIDRDSGQPREVFDPVELENLASSIAQVGGLAQLPLLKKHPSSPGRFMIVAGERRIRAMRNILKWDSYMFVITNRDLDTFDLSLIENLQRKDLNPIEDAKAYRKCRDRGMTWQAMEKMTGKNYMTLSNRIKLLGLPEEIQDMVAQGKMPSMEKVLTLAQYKKTPKGELIRMAHSLIAGEETLELAEKRLGSGRRDKDVLRFLPDTPEGLLRRIMDFGWKNRGSTLAMVAFCKLGEKQRRETWNKLQPATRASIAVKSAELATAIRDFITVIAGLDGTASPVTTSTPSRPPPTPPQYTALPRQEGVTRVEIGSRAVPGHTGLVAWKSDAPPPAQKAKSESNFSNETLAIGAKVVRFFGKTLPTSNLRLLSKEVLSQVIGTSKNPDETERFVLSGLRAVRSYWQSNPTEANGDPSRRASILSISGFRYDNRGCDFSYIMGLIKKRDRSKDPVNLDAL